MKLGRIGGNTDRTDWSGVYFPSDNTQKLKKIENIENYVWRRNYAFNSPFLHITQPSISYGDNDSKIYISDGSTVTNQEIRQYDLTTPGDASTASYSNKSVSVLGQYATSYINNAFSPDGTRMYISFYGGGNQIFQPPEQFNLSTAWDISTAVPKVKRFYLGLQETVPNGMYVKPDGTKMYIVGSTGDDINEYDLSTAYDISTASYNQNFSVSAQETAPQGIEFKPDGTKMYVVGTTGDDINEYNLSTAWDVSTASYNQNFSVSAQETSPIAVRFKPDGTKMFVTGYTGDDVNEYSLSTAWDISTASYVQNFATGDSTQTAVAFSDDGTKMYTTGITLDYIKEWDLSTAWSLSSVTFVQDSGTFLINPYSLQLLNGNKLYVICNFAGVDTAVGYTLNTDKDIRTIDGILQGDSELSNGLYDLLGGIGISADGTKFFVVDWDNNDRITEFTLPTPYELAGATRTGNFISIEPGTNESIPYSVHFSEDGTKIYIGGGDTTRAIYLYKLSTAWDITTATLSKQRLNLYSIPYTTSSNYDTLTEAENYGAGSVADVEGLAFTKDGTGILMATNTNYSEFKLPVN
tara:strand:+ start:46 stop:1785 length:1740 start_codon:yes stop_codon:yes gene_type:complete